MHNLPALPSPALPRRQFLAQTGAAALALGLAAPLRAAAQDAPKLKLGLIGCGGRGLWIADLFQKHGGYEFTAVADYFPDKAATGGKKLGVDPARCFSGLSGYRKLLAEPVDAVVIETPPYFHPEQAAAAVDAGKHVYLAKPIAVDVPGCQSVEASGRKATQQQRAFLVDFQTRANQSYQEAVKRVQDGMIGKVVFLDAAYYCGSTFGGQDQYLRAHPNDPEARLRAWGLDRTLSGDIITEQNIHALDVASWFLDATPVKAYGLGGKQRPFLGDCWDHFAVIYQYPGGINLNFDSRQFGYAIDDILCRAHGLDGTAETHYFGEVWVKSKDDGFNGGRMGNLYTEGAVANIATFHQAIRAGDFRNPTVAPSVRSNLTTILGRTAAYRGGELTWEEMLRQPEAFKLDTAGLKA
jgi:myo-inositol 2-dehydrogenase/D-chiro-inositol 1-dehydrogenase